MPILLPFKSSMLVIPLSSRAMKVVWKPSAASRISVMTALTGISCATALMSAGAEAVIMSASPAWKAVKRSSLARMAVNSVSYQTPRWVVRSGFASMSHSGSSTTKPWARRMVTGSVGASLRSTASQPRAA